MPITTLADDKFYNIFFIIGEKSFDISLNHQLADDSQEISSLIRMYLVSLDSEKYRNCRLLQFFGGTLLHKKIPDLIPFISLLHYSINSHAQTA